jgi:hypothetical protein
MKWQMRGHYKTEYTATVVTVKDTETEMEAIDSAMNFLDDRGHAYYATVTRLRDNKLKHTITHCSCGKCRNKEQLLPGVEPVPPKSQTADLPLFGGGPVMVEDKRFEAGPRQATVFEWLGVRPTLEDMAAVENGRR